MKRAFLFSLVFIASIVGACAQSINSGSLMPSLPTGATQAINSSYVANNTMTATITSAAGRTAYLTGFWLLGNGATAAITDACSITGLLGGTQTFGYPVPTGAGVAGPVVALTMPFPLVASGQNVNIVVTCAAFGAGSLGQSLMVFGYLI
jgi:hypothetical protein